MIGSQASGDGALDLLAVQRDDELLDLLGGRVAVPSDDELVRLLAAWRDEIDDGLPGVVPAPRSAPDAVRTRTPAVAAAAVPGRPANDLVPAAGLERSPRRRLTATGTAAALVLGGTLSLSGVAAAVTGDPLAPYRAVGHALSIGGDPLPEHAAAVAQLNKQLTRARAAVAHGDVAGAQAAVDALTAQLASADLTDQQRGAIERRLASLRAARARAAAAEAERGRNQGRAKTVATPPPHGDADQGGNGQPAGGNEQGGSAADGTDDPAATDGSSGSAKATKPANKPTTQPTKPAPDHPDPADENAPTDSGDETLSDNGDTGTGGGDQSGDQSGDAGRSAGGGSSTRGRSTGASAVVEQTAPEQASLGQASPEQAADGAAFAAEPAARAAGGSAGRR